MGGNVRISLSDCLLLRSTNEFGRKNTQKYLILGLKSVRFVFFLGKKLFFLGKKLFFLGKYLFYEFFTLYLPKKTRKPIHYLFYFIYLKTKL